MDNHVTIVIQNSNSSDGSYDVHQPRPYPFFVDKATGEIDKQEFWKGNPFRVEGFQDDVEVQQIDLSWEDAVANLDEAVGKYLVVLNTSGKEGVLEVFRFPVESAAVVEAAQQQAA